MVMQAKETMMETIWENLSKSPDEEHVTLEVVDIEELWTNGFVDSDSYSMKDWKDAFEPHKTPDGKYILKKEDFLEKEKYRYTGEIMIPFEPILINEGKYTDEGLQELIDMSIAPSCALPRKDLDDFFDEFKNKYRGADNLIVMDIRGKRDIEALVDKDPSPRRRRELIFDAMFIQDLARAATDLGLMKATPEQAAKVQVSTFTTLPSSKSEAAARELKSIEKRKEAKATGGGDEGVSVRKVRKSRKGFRG